MGTAGQHWKRVWRRTVTGLDVSSNDVPRVDEPPYEITVPPCDDDGRDSLFLCENMPARPSLAFEQRATGWPVFDDEGLALRDADGDTEYYAALLTDETDLEPISRSMDLIEETDFTSEALLVVQTGYGSSSIVPHVKRIETTDDGIHAFGCDEIPCGRTEDVTVRTAMVRFDRPEMLESAVVSLTSRDDTRVTFSDDGIVTVENGEIVDDTAEDLPRVDEPPYEITEPSCGDGRRDPHWLCENVPAEPSLAFEQETAGRLVLQDEGIDWLPERDVDGQQSQYYAALLTDEDDLERVNRESGGDAVDLLEGTDFSSEAALVVQSGWGSSSTPPHLERIAATTDGVRADGCHADPCDQTDDVTVRTVVARFERLETLESGVIRLITDPETRVNVRASDGVVTVEDGEVV